MSKESIAFDGRDWDTLGERGNLLAGEGWRYIQTGHVRHLTMINIFSAENIAKCGLNTEWYGTGSQEEYEKLASLPKCLNCMRTKLYKLKTR